MYTACHTFGVVVPHYGFQFERAVDVFVVFSEAVACPQTAILNPLPRQARVFGFGSVVVLDLLDVDVEVGRGVLLDGGVAG